jgi:dTDP-4-amino-4,6-dideoxygalactose transaminase
VNINFVDLRKQYAPFKDDILTGIENVLDGMQLFLGENVQQFEKEFAQVCGTSNGIGVGDGTAALHIILRGLGIGPGDEVITVSHTFIATAEAIVLTGAKPVFVDIDPHTYLMDVSQVENKITPHTKAILPIHLYGQTVDMDPLLDIASRHGLKVIEDACQAHGAKYKGREAGSLGDAAAFSFYYSKNLGAYGEAGFISTNNDELAETVRKIRDHGSGIRYHHDILGFNSRLDEIQAVILRAKLPHLMEWCELRRKHANKYNELLSELPLLTPGEKADNTPVYHLYVIKTAQRDKLQTFLKEKGIHTGIHYPIPIHQQKAFKDLGFGEIELPITEETTPQILSLPMFPELSDEEIKYIADSINTFYREQA